MSAFGDRRAMRPALPVLASRLLAAVLASGLAAGCDDTVEPFLEDEDAVFSMFGYLDLKADTQWVRVMPVRRTLLLDPEPIDAVVTLEQLDSDRILTLNDSLFSFVDPGLGAVAYAHNFWTSERLQPGASYRLRAVRSDGASTTAVVEMPPALEILFLENRRDQRFGSILALLQVRAERVLFVQTLYGMGLLVGDPPDTLPATSIAVDEHFTFDTHVPGTQGVGISTDTLIRPGLVDLDRKEIRVITGRADWPYHPELTDLTITLPNTAPSNVENGLGFVGGVASWTIPFDDCEVLAARPDRESSCATLFDTRSASIAGRVIAEPCGDPRVGAHIRLTETFAGGGAVARTWKTGWRGRYRFEGIEPNSELLVEVLPDGPPVQVPRLADGERYAVEDITVQRGC